MINNKNTRVYVAVSGGVDSSVALALLQDDGYDVTGVYFKTYKPEANEQESRKHCRQQGLDAQAVCEHLSVPFKVFDLEQEYKQKVFDYMIAEYKAGKTPNPDIICNKEIKFGIFAEMAFADGADYIATGHYARLNTQQPQGVSDCAPLLMTAADTDKDQTYFLSQVRCEVLVRTKLPIGEYKKSKVRELAKGFGLLTASKKDSQGICFIGHKMNVKDFLKKYISEQRGDVLDTSGNVIGEHNGAKLLTVGERIRKGHGFTINPRLQTPEMPRLFVIQRDIDTNSIIVGTIDELEQEQRGSTSLLLGEANWISKPPKINKEYKCRIRHRGKLYRCKINKNKVEFIDMPYAPAAGQFIALYDGDICLGSGVML